MLKKIELIFWLNMLGAIAFYLFGMPMVGSMVIVSTAILSLFYMYLSFAILNGIRGRKIFTKGTFKEINNLRIIGTVALGLCYSLVLITMLFTLMLWPSMLVNLIAAIAGLLIGGGLSIWKFLQQNNPVYKGILLRTSLFLFIAIGLLVLPKYSVLEWRYGDHPGYVEAFKARDQHPSDPKLIEKLEEERLKILEEEVP